MQFIATTGKKKKRRKKKKKKAQFHFVPKPLGPKADLMIRLDKVHHNVKNIASIVKGGEKNDKIVAGV